MTVKCTVVIQKEENWFVATCVENNVASQGKTLDETIESLKEAVALYYDDTETTPVFPPVFFTTMEVAT